VDVRCIAYNKNPDNNNNTPSQCWLATAFYMHRLQQKARGLPSSEVSGPSVRAGWDGMGEETHVLQTRQAFLPDTHPETRLAHLHKGEGRHRLGKMFVLQRDVERGNSCLFFFLIHRSHSISSTRAQGIPCLEQRLSCDPRLRQGRAFGSVRHLVTPSHSPTSTLQLPCPLLHAVEFPISIRKRPDGKVEVARKVPEGVGTHACVTAKGGGGVVRLFRCAVAAPCCCNERYKPVRGDDTAHTLGSLTRPASPSMMRKLP
jgi:hypothetical protein